MAYSVRLDKRVEKDLAVLPSEARARIGRKIGQLEQDPFPKGVIELHGEDSYRIRIGDYRVVHDVDASAQTVTVLRVAHRKDIYR